MVDRMDRVDIVVGIPSLNEADSIPYVARQVSLGLTKYFPTFTSIIINVDNNSEDGTREAFLSSSTGSVPKRYITTGKGVFGKGNNLRNLFKEVERHKAKAVVVVDADLKSLTPEWVKTLVMPILDGNDYVTPIYSRHHYDGTITNHVCYPLIYGLFKANIRQPIAGDFSFSPKMVRFWLGLDWRDSTRQYGIDIFMTTAALFNGFRCCQVVLGAKIHKPSAPKLGPMFTQVVTTLFENILQFRDSWMNGRAAKDCPVLGRYSHHKPKPQNLSVDYERLKGEAMEGFLRNDETISTILSHPLYDTMKKMYILKRWNIGAGLWVKVLYDFIYSYETAEDKEKVIEALKPLYFARAASFYKETLNISHIDAEEKIQKQAVECRRLRNYLVKRFEEKASVPILRPF